ncbi:hypothetical protein SDJN02_18396, partial [Cucurbita argyrosperma subsp. argyrosperma]
MDLVLKLYQLEASVIDGFLGIPNPVGGGIWPDYKKKLRMYVMDRFHLESTSRLYPAVLFNGLVRNEWCSTAWKIDAIPFVMGTTSSATPTEGVLAFWVPESDEQTPGCRHFWVCFLISVASSLGYP